MSTAARKARRKAGIPFTKPQKVATPLDQRSFVTKPVRRVGGDAMPLGAPAYSTHRSPRRVLAFILSGGREHVALPKGDR